MSISSGIVNSITAALARSLSGLVYAYDFNGVNNAVETYRPIIPDATTDNFTQSVTLYGVIPTDGVLFAKNLSATDANKELEVLLSSSEIKVVVGGTTTSTGVNITTEGVYIFSFESDLVITRNGAEIYNAALTRGTATEPTATMTYAAGHNGTLTTYTDYYDGVLRNCLTNVTESSTPLNRYVRAGNGVNAHALFPESTLSGDFEVEIKAFIDISAVSALDNFYGSESSNRTELLLAASGNLTVWSGASNVFDTSAAAYDLTWVTLKITRTGNQWSFAVNNDSKGTVADSSSDVSIGTLFARSSTTNLASLKMTDFKLWTGGSRVTGTLARYYKLDEALYNDALVDYSGNNQDGTYYQFDQSDISFAPLLDVSFKIDDNSADLADSLGGADAEIKNHDPANWSQINA